MCTSVTETDFSRLSFGPPAIIFRTVPYPPPRMRLPAEVVSGLHQNVPSPRGA